jgi:hypothetical protein
VGAGAMRLRQRGVVAAIPIVVLLWTVGAVVAAASITLKPSTGPRDDGENNQTVITASGSFGVSVGTITVWWDVEDSNHQQSPSAVLNEPGPGDFSFTLPVPLYESQGGPPVRPGAHKVIVCGNSPAAVACAAGTVSATFTIPAPTVSLSKISGRQGDSLTVHGSGFSPAALGELVRVIWDPAGTQQVLYENNPGFSTFDVTIVVPDVAAGKYPIRVCDVPVRTTLCNSLDLAAKPFTILSPVVSIDHSSGLAGATVNVSGHLFHPQRELHLYFGTTANPKLHEISPGTTKQTNSDGVFEPYPYSPTDAPGSYVVTACTYAPSAVAGVCDPNDTATAPYSILAPPTPTPSPKPTPTHTPPPTPSPTPTATTSAPAPTPTVAPSATATLAVTPTPTASATATLLPTVGPSQSETAPPSASPTSSAVVEPPANSPTPAPTASASTDPLSWPQHLSAPGSPRGFGDIGTVAAGAILALLIAFLIPFPGTLFNKTVEANYAEIMGWVAGAKQRWNAVLDAFAVGPLGAGRRWLGRALSGRTGVLVFLALSALVYGFLSPSFGFDLNSAALFLGLLVGLAFITAAFDLPLRIYHRRRTEAHDAGVLRALWWTLLIAIICVVISRLAGFQPGYLYGLIISIVFVSEVSAREEGIGTWLASVWLLVLSVVAWVLLAIVRQQSTDPWLSLFVQTMLVTFVVAGIETLVIGLLPMRFLPGHPLFRWRKSLWFALFALSVFGYLLILVDPANGYLSDDSRTPMIVGIVFLVGFGIISIGTWAYFRYRPSRPGGDRPGEAAAD